MVSIIRLRSLINFANSHNITWDYMEAAYWSTIELDVGIVIACLPAVRALFTKLGSRAISTLTGSSAQSGSRTIDSKLTLSNANKPQLSPRSGDERDFIPLMDVELGESGKRGAEKGSTAGSSRVKVTAESASDSDTVDYHGRPANHDYM